MWKKCPRQKETLQVPKSTPERQELSNEPPHDMALGGPWSFDEEVGGLEIKLGIYMVLVSNLGLR